MQLPFTHDQFLDVFASYNRALWPVAFVLWLGTVVLVGVVVRRRSGGDVTLAGLLAIHWAWAGVVYHLVYFRTITPAAVGFAALFVAQAALILWRGLARRGLTFTVGSSIWSVLGIALVVYALIYPVVGLVFGLRYPRLPTFGVPCPTAILTAGLLLLAPLREARWLAPILVIWAVVGGSAAFVLSIRADLGLVAAGLLLLVYVARTKERVRANSG